jgi:hypothetical protein
VHLTNEDVREILKLLDESPYDELKIDTDGFSLTLKRSVGRRTSRAGGSARRRDRMTGARRG